MNEKLKKYITIEVATLFSISIRFVQRIWKRGKKNLYDDVADVSHRKTKNCGLKRIEIDRQQFPNLPSPKRKTIRDTAHAIIVSTWIIYINLQSGDVKRHTDSTKQFLIEENKKNRMRFRLSMLDKVSLLEDPKYVGMFNIVHTDEKWFDLSKKTDTY